MNTNNLIIDAEHLYVDENKTQAMLMYAPIENGDGTSSDEYSVRRNIHQILLEQSRKYDINMQKIVDLLSDYSVPLINVVEQLKDMMKVGVEKPIGNEDDISNIRETHKLIMKTTDYSNDLVFEISLQDNEKYVIGKNPQMVNGVISDPKVSRRHCEIFAKNGEYYIKDLNSTNGTFVNGVRLKNEEKLLVDNITIRIAHLDFIGRIN